MTALQTMQSVPQAADYIRILPEIVLSIFGMISHAARSGSGRTAQPTHAGRDRAAGCDCSSGSHALPGAAAILGFWLL